MALVRNKHVSAGRRLLLATLPFLQHSLPPVTVVLVSLITGLVLTGCSTPAKAPVVSREPVKEKRAGVSTSGQSRQQPARGHHRVQKGDTLYSIAWRYNLDYRRLADWNGISEPYVIYPGQDIRLTPAPGQTRDRSAQSRSKSVATPEKKSPSRKTEPSSASSEQGAARDSVINWQWPTPGEIVQLDTPIAKKGVNIAGRQGQSIMAAAGGRVVYSGSGLLGYGKLIIIKHSDVYLSAYAHNDEIYVKEGDRVAVGQKIATMGLGNNGKPVLHFEIRKDGKPVSPLYHLPENRS